MKWLKSLKWTTPNIEQLYHMSCPSCGKDWWDKNAFPLYCPYCNTNRMPERKDGDGE